MNNNFKTNFWNTIVEKFNEDELKEYRVFVGSVITAIEDSFIENVVTVEYDKGNELILCYTDVNDKNTYLYIPVVDNYTFYHQCLLEIVDDKEEHIKDITDSDRRLVMEKVIKILTDKIVNNINLRRHKKVSKDFDKILDIVTEW